MSQGVPYDEFVKTWTTPEPPKDLPYMGCWDKKDEVYGIVMGQRIKMKGTELQGQFMLNPKDVEIAALKAEVASLKQGS